MTKGESLVAVGFAATFLLFVQSIGSLLEGIYIQNLLRTSLNAQALAILLVFGPLLILPWYRDHPRPLAWLLFGLLLLARGVTPYLDTASRTIAAGVATSASLGLLLLLLRGHVGEGPTTAPGTPAAVGFAVFLGLAVVLRTVGHGLDYSLIPDGRWLGWLLVLPLGRVVRRLTFDAEPTTVRGRRPPVVRPLVGVYLVLGLAWFAFAAPSVVARWTEADHRLITVALSGFSLGTAWVLLARPGWLARVSRRRLTIWNLLFVAALTATLLAHRVSFPPTPESPAVVVGPPGWAAQLPLVAMLALFPVLVVDLGVLVGELRRTGPAPGRLAAGVSVGGLALVLVIFADIFSNVWAYVPPISPLFRNTYWLAYAVLGAGVTWSVGRASYDGFGGARARTSRVWPAVLAAVLVVTVVALVRTQAPAVPAAGRHSLVVMTMNTQQSNDGTGERSFAEQLALIRTISPDVLALQESDSARISLNNNDYVRYFADALGYYAYYGPTPETGTFGTAILSKYPLEHPRTRFVYSDNDETGLAEAEISVGGRRLTIVNVHPDGSDQEMAVFARTLVALGGSERNFIVLGDFNLRPDQAAYRIIDAAFDEAWADTHPAEAAANGATGRDRIDHIFVSGDLVARTATYLPPPESATDHPVHWAEIAWADQATAPAEPTTSP